MVYIFQKPKNLQIARITEFGNVAGYMGTYKNIL